MTASLKPTPKVIAATAAGAATVLLVWIAGLFGLEVPPEVAAAATVLLTAGAGYLWRG
jgi:hypothetical protein